MRSKLFFETSQLKHPDSLKYKQQSIVAFALETAGPGTSAQMLSALPGSATTKTVQVSDRVKASLTGASDNVAIELQKGEETKIVTDVSPPTWTWYVKNLDGQKVDLTLTVSTVIKDDEPPIVLETMYVSIPVYMDPIDYINFYIGRLAPIGASIVSVCGAIAGAVKFLKDRGNKPDNPDKPQDSAPDPAEAPAGA